MKRETESTTELAELVKKWQANLEKERQTQEAKWQAQETKWKTKPNDVLEVSRLFAELGGEYEVKFAKKWEAELEAKFEAEWKAKEAEWDTKAIDYYVLYCDTEDTTPIDDATYAERCWQQDLLLADKSRYIWGYVGKLSESQAMAADARLTWELSANDQGLGISDEDCTDIYGLSIDGNDRKLLDFLATLTPNLAFLSSVSPTHRFWFFPETHNEACEILKGLTRSKQKYYSSLTLYPSLNDHTGRESFWMLVPVRTLMHCWLRVGYFPPMNPIRRTAATLCIDGLCGSIFLRQSGDRASIENTETIFKSTVLDEHCISTNRIRHLNFMRDCVDIVNSIRTADDCEDKNIDNTYEVIIKKRKQKRKENANDCSATPSQALTADVQAASSVNVNSTPTAPKAEPEQPPVVPEPVDGEEDVLDLYEKVKGQGRWVSQRDFLDPNINSNRSKIALKSLRTYRETRNVVWSKKKPTIGMDKAGNFLERLVGKQPNNYRYWYFLLEKFDKTAASPRSQ